jgi:hypothetical protein
MNGDQHGLYLKKCLKPYARLMATPIKTSDRRVASISIGGCQLSSSSQKPILLLWKKPGTSHYQEAMAPEMHLCFRTQTTT